MSTPDFAAEFDKWASQPREHESETGEAVFERMYDLGRSSGAAAEAYRAALKAAGEVVARVRCETCEGTGLMGGECEACAEAGYRSKDCGMCNGTGRWEDTCAACDGAMVTPEYEAIAQAILALPIPAEFGGKHGND